VFFVEMAHIFPSQKFHKQADISSFTGVDNKVKMVRHQAIAIQLAVVLFPSLPQNLKKQLIIPCFKKYWYPIVPSLDYMTGDIWYKET
jgi:hypothetical protein